MSHIDQRNSSHRKAASTPPDSITILVKFSPNQRHSVCIFCRSKNLHPDSYLVRYNNPIPFKKDTNFFGISLDSKLTFAAHIIRVLRKSVSKL